MTVPAEKLQIRRIDATRARWIVERLKSHFHEDYELILELSEGEGWASLGYTSWSECLDREFGQVRSYLYEKLEAAKVVRELESNASHKHVSVRNSGQHDGDSLCDNTARSIPISQLVALSKAPEGTRSEVLDVATEVSAGKPTAKVVKAAVEAKKANPTATPAELVKAVVEAKPAASPKPVVPDAVEDVREELAERAAIRAETSDDEWLASLPLSGVLEGHALDKFHRDALDYRDLESTVPANVPLRKAVADFLSRTKRRQKGRTPNQGFTAFRAGQLLSVEHPRAWFRCPPTEKGGCGGTGTVGSVGQCPMCFGRGYLPR